NPYGEVIRMVNRLIYPFGEAILLRADVILLSFGTISSYADITTLYANTLSACRGKVSQCAGTSLSCAEMIFLYADPIPMNGSCVQSCAEATSTYDDMILPSDDVAFPFGFVAVK